MSTTQAEIAAGKRFAFGNNWHDFVGLVDESRIRAAIDSLGGPLGGLDLSSCRFLDIGCGSGLFSLAATRLGAQVHSFDFDEMSVMAAKQLRTRFARDASWMIEQGSVLDESYMEGLGCFDVVYAWGVLHHTGAMWEAIEAAARAVGPGGTLFLSIYNDQGGQSRMWRHIKERYNKSGRFARSLLITGSILYLSRGRLLNLASRAARHSTPVPAHPVRTRGMSARHDLVDWVGGYPFEVAKPEEVFTRVGRLGFELRHLKTCAGGIGCNEYVFERKRDASSR